MRPKTGQFLFGLLVWRKIIFFQFFLLDRWTTCFTSFLGKSSTSNSNSIWAHGEVFLKKSIRFVFSCIFWGAPSSHVAKIVQGLKGMVLRKKFVSSIESWFSHFFCSWFYMMSPSMWPLWSKCEVFYYFQKNITRSFVLKF